MEGREEEEEEEEEKKKGNSWKGKEDEGEIRTFCESSKPGEIEVEGKPNAAAVAGADGGVANAEMENNVAAAESFQLEKKSGLCTGIAGAEVEVHR